MVEIRAGAGGNSLNPLTHHEILELIGPFTRRGRHVDLAVTDRLQRRIAFQSRDIPGTSGCPGLRETLSLEDLGSGSYRLTRLLSPPAGPAASLEVVGPRPGDLLERIEEVVSLAAQSEAVCVSLPDERLGEELGILLRTVVAGSTLQERKPRIYSSLQQEFGQAFRSANLMEIDSLPLNESSKIDRKRSVRILQGRQGR